ncbi:MAG TPA: hypothetical protein VGD37_29570 [Kofleriaceae bacterium]|jgi:hypothetical protein
MKLCVTLCVLWVVGTSSIASAQLVNQCSQDALTVPNAQGRNAWAANCGYTSSAGAAFYDSQNLYVEFTSGCGHAGCSPFIPVVATDPCIPNLVRLGLCEDQAMLTVSSFHSGVDVFTASRFDECPLATSCSFSYEVGQPVTVEVTNTEDFDACVRFTGWSGACAGQGASCNLVLGTNMSTTSRWGRITNCTFGCLIAPCQLTPQIEVGD